MAKACIRWLLLCSTHPRVLQLRSSLRSRCLACKRPPNVMLGPQTYPPTQTSLSCSVYGSVGRFNPHSWPGSYHNRSSAPPKHSRQPSQCSGVQRRWDIGGERGDGGECIGQGCKQAGFSTNLCKSSPWLLQHHHESQFGDLSGNLHTTQTARCNTTVVTFGLFLANLATLCSSTPRYPRCSTSR